MKAMILAAGEGTRLAPLIERRSKPILPLLNQPLLTHTLSDFESVGTAGSEAARLASALVADTATRALLAQPDPAVGRTAEVQALCKGPSLGSAGGPTLMHLGPIARLAYEGVLTSANQVS